MRYIISENKLQVLVQNYIKDQIDKFITHDSGLYDLILIVTKDDKTIFEVSKYDGLVGVADWFYESLKGYFGLSEELTKKNILKVLEETLGRSLQAVYVTNFSGVVDP